MLSSAAVSALEQIVGAENVLTDSYSLDCYSGDALNPYRAYGAEEAFERLADAVVRPGNAGQVSEIVSWAMKAETPLIPMGGGTGVMGGTVPAHGGVVVDLKRMDRILEVNPKDLTAVVEGGVVLHDLEEELADYGLMPGHDPYSVPIATVAGDYIHQWSGLPCGSLRSHGRPRWLHWKWSCPTGGL